LARHSLFSKGNLLDAISHWLIEIDILKEIRDNHALDKEIAGQPGFSQL
jgi:hypothetical protein